ncbi:hypothetical protein BDZ89DRAFT_248427 [Hymenopellis radicata]|nr:hypothetical protein BDZ89DRAFT_248427 [Hymenopellis radicata]
MASHLSSPHRGLPAKPIPQHPVWGCLLFLVVWGIEFKQHRRRKIWGNPAASPTVNRWIRVVRQSRKLTCIMLSLHDFDRTVILQKVYIPGVDPLVLGTYFRCAATVST